MTFIPQYEPLIKPSYADAVSKQILSGWIGPDKTTEAFEAKICEITGADYCISTTSGTTALMIALKVLTPEDYWHRNKKIIMFPAYTFLAGANAARFLDHKVKLVDIKRTTLCMNPGLLHIGAGEGENMGPIIFVNHNGYVGEDVKKTRNFCNMYKVPMIEDASQALGIPNAGRTGDVGIFSFSVPKLVTTGQGGAIITDDPHLAIECRRVRDHGDQWRKTRIHKNLGVNFKFNDILASYGLEQLNHIDELLAERKRVFDAYRKHIKLVDFGYESTWMVIHENNKADKIIEDLKKQEIQAVKYYEPIHKNPPYGSIDHFPEAEYVAKHLVHLPSSLTIKDEDIDRICQIILEA